MKLIVTADDFGRSREINAAVVEAHARGILTSASLMVAGDAFEDAVEIARRMPTLAIGLHVVLVDGKAVLPAERIWRLVDGRGYFPDTPARLGMRYFFDPRARLQLAEEIEAQFSRFAQTGLPLAHVDGHQHMHVHPAVFPLILILAERYGAGGVRVPRDELRFALRYDRRRAMQKTLWKIAFAILGRKCRQQMRGRRLTVAQRVYGLMQTGQMHQDYLVKLLQHVHAESAEIYLHPTAGPRTDELGPNPDELAALLSTAARAVIQSRRLSLCAYPGLSRQGAR